MSKTFNVSIITPGKIPLEIEVESLITETNDGRVEFKANHIPIILSTIPCKTILVSAIGKEDIFTSSGIIYLKNNKLKFCCDAAERKEDIDVERAKESKARAEERLKKQKEIDIERAKRSLARAIKRINIVSING